MRINNSLQPPLNKLVKVKGMLHYDLAGAFLPNTIGWQWAPGQRLITASKENWADNPFIDLKTVQEQERNKEACITGAPSPEARREMQHSLALQNALQHVTEPSKASARDA